MNINNVLSLALLATCSVLAACQKDANSPTTVGTEAAASDAVQPEAAMALVEAFNAQDESAQAVDAAAVSNVDAPLHCSVDSINEAPASDGVSLKRSERVRFSGFIEAASLDEPSILVLRSDEAAYFVNNVPAMERSDIAQYKGIQNSSAFDYSTFATLDAVPPGTYTVELLAKDGEAFRRCSSSVAVVIE